MEEIKITVRGQEITAQISERDAAALVKSRTGYERVNEDEQYYYIGEDCNIDDLTENNDTIRV